MAALEGLYRLFERVAIYPPEHPVVGQVRDRTHEILARAVAGGRPLRVEATRRSLRLASRPLDSVACRALGTALAELDIVELELRDGVTPEEILDLARRLADLKASGGAEAARATLLDGELSPHVRVALLDYDALPIDEGAAEEEEKDEPGVAEDPERIFQALSETLLQPEDDRLAPEQLAGLLGEEIEMDGGDAEVLSGQLQRLLDDVESLDPEARREAQARIGRFLAALPEALRAELLRIDPTLAHAKHLRPDSLVTALLLGAVQGGDRPPEDAVALLNQLLRSSAEDVGLQDLLTRVAAGEADPAELDRLGAAVSEIFRKREDIQANPEDYQALIDSLATSGAKAVASPDRWSEALGDPRDAAENRAHAVEIAAEQFGDRNAAEYAESALAYLRDSVDALIESGRLAALEAAVRAVDAFAASEEASAESVRHSAFDWVRAAISIERIEQILAVACVEAEVAGPALALTRRAGSAAADAIFAALAGAGSKVLLEGLQEILAAMPAETVLAQARRRVDAGWAELRPLFPVLRRMEGAPVQDFLVGLLDHDDENVRSHALKSLNDRALEDGHAGDILFTLLQDPSPRIVREAIRKLGALNGQEAVDLLGDFVGGRMLRRASRHPLELRLLAIRVLTLRGAAGWERLERCLGRLSWRLRGPDVETAYAIASVLERRAPDPGTARALKRWQWSPARRLGGLLRSKEAGRQVRW